MKKLRFILAALVATFIAFTGGKVLADTYTITINGDTAGHTYEAYQIFKGDLSGDTLSNIDWGTGVTPFTYNSKSSASDIAATLKTDSDAKAFAAEAGKHLSTVTSGTYANGQITGLEAGYYLVKDKDNTVPAGGAYTSFILEVAKNVSVNTKSSVPTVEKKVKDINDSTDSEMSDWQDSADHDFGDKVPFQLTATLPSNFDSYKEYYLSFDDTLSAGLTYNNDAKVFLVNGSSKTDITSNFTVNYAGTSLTIKTSNLKKVADVNSSSKIVVEYSATLNEHAVIGSAGNPNEVKLIYSNNPNYTGDGENSPKGETPKDKVIVFTYKTVINKIDQNNHPLTGAEFKLFKVLKDGTEKEVTTVEKNASGDKFTFKGIDDGKYIFRETKTPAGYNTIKPITFTVTATHTQGDEPKLTDLNGEKVSGEITFTKDVDNGSLTTNVMNKKGSLLPNTGGIGTTILYVVGGVLVVSAGVLLVTRKRMRIK